MIEVHLAPHGNDWQLQATVLPYGGLEISTEATLATLSAPSFREALPAIESLADAQFTPNPDRWPVQEPKFLIINEGSHPDSEHFGNYRIERAGEMIARVTDFPRGDRLALIKKALELVAERE